MTGIGARVRLATFGLGLALVLGVAAPVPPAIAAPGAPPSPRRAPKTPTVYHKSRSFRIPFNVEPSERSRLKEVQLWVSEDSGFKWEARSKTTPDRPYFTFRAARAARGSARVIWVSNEVGSGVVPENALARRFADLQGLANQQLAADCDAVHLCVAGLPLRLK